MSTRSKYTREAKAIFDLYQTMLENIKIEIRELILSPKYKDLETEQLTYMANESFGDIWDDPINDHWDNFFKEKT